MTNKPLHYAISGTALAIAGLIAAPAQATAFDDNWRFDACGTGLFDCSDATVADAYDIDIFDEMSFYTVGVVNVADDVTNAYAGVPNPPETFTVKSAGYVTSFQNDNPTANPGLYRSTLGSLFGHNGWELTFTFDVSGQFTTADSTDISFTHMLDSASTGMLTFYLHEITDENSLANPEAKTNITFSTQQVAQFRLTPGRGGSYDYAEANGNDNASFEMISAMDNVWFASDGTDLADLIDATNSIYPTMGFSGGDFNTRPSNNDNASAFSFNPAGWTCGPNDGPTAVDFCFNEDGSFSLAVPEPGTLALLGAGLLGFGGQFRRRLLSSARA